MIGLIKTIKLADQMESFREFYFKLEGDKFLESVKNLEPSIRKKAKEAGTDNLIEAMLPLWTKMSKNNEDPGFLIAIVAQLIHQDKRSEPKFNITFG